MGQVSLGAISSNLLPIMFLSLALNALSMSVRLLFFELYEDGFEASGGDGELFCEFYFSGGWGKRRCG